MPVESPPSRDIAAALAHRLGKAADHAQITDAIVSFCQEVDTALRPVIGQQGVAALYKRSLFLNARTYPWLADIYEGVKTAIDFAALKALLSKQSGADAAASGGALLQTFYDLLATLIGLSLTEQLLRSVWPVSSNGQARQDTTR